MTVTIAHTELLTDRIQQLMDALLLLAQSSLHTFLKGTIHLQKARSITSL
jgi:argininosuccinate lyase